MKTRIILFLLCLCTLSVSGQGITRQKCPVCGKLKVQCPGHAKPPQPEPKPTFTCDKCRQKFNTQAQLNAHKAKAHPTPPAQTFNCTQCGQKFNTQAQLNVHKAKAHAASSARVSYDASSNSIVFGNNRYKMVYVSGGSFNMGATSEQGSDAVSDEKPAHRVTVSDYYIGQTEVTQALWKAVMGNNPSNWKNDNLPVESVSWNDCQTFIEKLNSLTGRTFRLPAEAEWEFASRGGNNSRGYKYSGSNYLGDVAWYTENSNGKTHAVATKQANELGIYDMSGNVWEWCSDWYDSNYYKNSDSNNPRGAYTGSYRVFRGGCWLNIARYCRVSDRSCSTPDFRGSGLGLRLALVP